VLELEVSVVIVVRTGSVSSHYC